MNFTLFLLGENPSCQEKVHEELDIVFRPERSHDDVTFEDLKELKYLENCIKESMRLFAPAPLMSRTLHSDLKLGN
jgi:cytochrome P450